MAIKNQGQCRKTSMPAMRKRRMEPWRVGSISEKGIVLFFFGDGGQWTVAGTDEGLGRQTEDLLADFGFGHVPGLVAVADGAGEDGIADDGDVRGVFGPGANNVS